MLMSTNKLILSLISLCILGHLGAHAMLRASLNRTTKNACIRLNHSSFSEPVNGAGNKVVDLKSEKIQFKAFLAYERDWTGRSGSEVSCALFLGETFEIPIQTIPRWGEISLRLAKKFKLLDVANDETSGEIILYFEYDNSIIKRKLELDFTGDIFATDHESLGCILYVKKQTVESE